NPYSDLKIQVREKLSDGTFEPWQEWTLLNDFPQGPGNYFYLQPVTGAINFGNYHPTTAPDGHGSIPPAGSEIQALTYRYVSGGVKGNIPSQKINIIRTVFSGLTGAINLGAATGGSDEESIEETTRRAPHVLRNRYRAVTAEDYEYLAREATTDVKKAKALSPRFFTDYDKKPEGIETGQPWTYGGLNRDHNDIHVIILPEAPLSTIAPRPSDELIKEVSSYLDARRVMTAKLNVTYPRYLPIQVVANVNVWQQAIDLGLIKSEEEVKQRIETDIERFLHPLLGGPDGEGWEVGQDVLLSTLFEFIQPDPDIAFIASLAIAADTPLYTPTNRPLFAGGESNAWIQVADYELVCFGSHKVASQHI
ncbi:MAG: baseplate J/gp47 family protein, partial [Anaerolineae bacterium]|nr:baseplate J/gp47 family protein [Anaerolineae bacterium]